MVKVGFEPFSTVFVPEILENRRLTDDISAKRGAYDARRELKFKLEGSNGRP